MFAEDVELIPENCFTELLDAVLEHTKRLEGEASNTFRNSRQFRFGKVTRALAAMA